MRICVIGKYPPIQGGVSMRTYWTAHRLAMRGHEVHVVTNAREVAPPFRMHMRPQDWQRCETRYGDGSVRVHWSDPIDRAQAYIPMASPFVSKLAGIAARLHAVHAFDVIYSHYLEPYGVAAHLAAQMTGAPHVARMAGSDAGRLWHHAQLEPLYDHVLRSAALVIAAGTVAERAVAHGVTPERIAGAGAFVVPEDLFRPDGATLDLAALRREVADDAASRDLMWGGLAPGRPHFGVCGKLGDSKGSFALLGALQRLARDGVDIGLVALAHGPPETESRFRAEADRLGVTDRILQIPFLPHWRVPDVLRGCLAVCCLEQDFPIGFHAPIIPREVLLTGTCLIASTEMIRKLPARGRLPDGYGCVAIADVNDVDALAARLGAIARDPAPAAAVGARGRAFAQDLQRTMPFPHKLEQLLEAVARRQPTRPAPSRPDDPQPTTGRFAFAELAARELAAGGASPHAPIDDLARAEDVKRAVDQAVHAGRSALQGLAAALAVEIAVAAAEEDGAPSDGTVDPERTFRLQAPRWAVEDRDLAGLAPLRDPDIRVLTFPFDVSAFGGVRTMAELPATPAQRRSFMVAFRHRNGPRRSPLLVDGLTARILALSDGSHTVAQIDADLREGDGIKMPADSSRWIEELFIQGLVSLREALPPEGHLAGPAASAGPTASPAV